MKNWKKALICVLGAALMLPALTACAPQEAVEEDKVVYEGTIEEKIDAFWNDHEDTAAGMMVGVFDKDGVIYKGYYGYMNIDAGIMVDEKTVIDWGSTTKTLVWVSVMQLWEQGKIDLNEDIRTYLPDGFLTNLSYDKPITMIDLMNHQAGFQEYYTDMMVLPSCEPVSLEEALKQDQPAQIFEPGTVTAYSNWGVALAGYIVECVSGESFCDYVHENIFEPLGMNDTALAPDLSDNPSVKKMRDMLYCYSGTTSMSESFYIIQLYPAGACVSTLDDYIKFGSCFVQDEFPLFENPETFDVMMSATSYFGDTDVAKNAHGFWALPYGDSVYGHGGNTQGCSSYITFDPVNQIGCVVMTNQSGETTFNMDMMELIYGESTWDFPAVDGIKDGVYHPARTVLQGHFKLMGATFMSTDSFEDWYWTYNEEDGIPKFEGLYGDYYLVPVSQMVIECVLIYGWILSLVVALIALVVKFIRFIVRKLMKSKKKTILGTQVGLACWLELTIALAGGAAMLMMGMWVPISVYGFLFPVVGVLTLVLAALAVFMVIKFIATARNATVLRKIINICSMLFAVLNVVLVVYFELWH